MTKTIKEELEVGDIIMIEYGYRKVKAEVVRIYRGDIICRVGSFPLYHHISMNHAFIGGGEDWYFLRKSFKSYIKSLISKVIWKYL